MQNKLLIVSFAAIMGIVGCSKEEETAAISSDVGQVQSSTTSGVAATTATPGSQATTASTAAVATAAAATTEASMPVVSNKASDATAPTSSMPVVPQPAQVGSQSQESLSAGVPTQKTSETLNPYVSQGQVQAQAQQNLTPNITAKNAMVATPATASTSAQAAAPSPSPSPTPGTSSGPGVDYNVPKQIIADTNPVEVVDTTKIQEPPITVIAPVSEGKASSEVKQLTTGVANTAAMTTDKVSIPAVKKLEEAVVVGQPKK